MSILEEIVCVIWPIPSPAKKAEMFLLDQNANRKEIPSQIIFNISWTSLFTKCYRDIFILESWNNSCWKGPQIGSTPVVGLIPLPGNVCQLNSFLIRI